MVARIDIVQPASRQQALDDVDAAGRVLYQW